MVWLLGHRQPKGAVNGDARPNATAPHLDSTGCRSARVQGAVRGSQLVRNVRATGDGGVADAKGVGQRVSGDRPR
jgi:hypothetical protein